MKRPDRYDIIGATILGFVVALFVAHFVLPPAPPLDDDAGAPSAAPGIGAGVGGGIGGGIAGPGLGAPGGR